MQTQSVKTPIQKFYEWESHFSNRIFLRQAHQGQWLEYTWGEVARQARIAAQALKAMGCEPGDRVAILSKNCAHWIIADLAIMLAKCVSVPLYPTQQADSIDYVLKHCEAKVIFLGKLDNAKSLEIGIPKEVRRISFPYPLDLGNSILWADLLESYQPLSGSDSPDPHQLATIIYTSGTTGVPKGVMHTYSSIAHAVEGFQKTLQFTEKDRLFSYLPLSHVAERVLVEMLGIYSSTTISFAESLETFARDLQSVKPTAFFSVPRLWKKFQLGVLGRIPQSKLDVLLAIPIVSQIISYKIRKGLGLHKARSIGSGAAPIVPALLQWYRKIGIKIMEGYGLTENFGYATSNRRGNNKIGTVGPAQPDTTVSISKEGEIFIKNKATMSGYYRDPEATREVLKDDLFRTGDIGEVDSHGYLKITGRIKEIFKTDKGKYVAPAPIEHSFLSENPHIEQICVMGHALVNPVALCVLTESARRQSPDTILKDFNDTLLRLNKKLPSHERIDRCILIEDDWTVDTGMMTPTLKVKRRQVEDKYRHVIAKSLIGSRVVVYENVLR